ncbi:MAG: hypothetical protein BVN33_17755 [Proteobacteria bacterium ST_bin13]|nr:MAG: hypothetical protein BVN33_17755 [Proteobacteria bacterium ST_bin13]
MNARDGQAAQHTMRSTMPIDIIVGLPHLNEGPILQRARALRTNALISANGLSRWSETRP